MLCLPSVYEYAANICWDQACTIWTNTSAQEFRLFASFEPRLGQRTAWSKAFWDSSSWEDFICCWAVCQIRNQEAKRLLTVHSSTLLDFFFQVGVTYRAPQITSTIMNTIVRRPLTPLHIPGPSSCVPVGPGLSLSPWALWSGRPSAGTTSKCVHLQTWGGMIMKRDCLLCSSHMGPALLLPPDFLSVLPIILEEITACPELLRTPVGSVPALCSHIFK